MKVATSIQIGKEALPELASRAVKQAMQKAGLSTANSVLLLLSAEFASNPQPAVKAAAIAANCTQVLGCSTTGIFTEEDWVMDAPAAAVMVFGGEISLQLPHTQQQNQPLLTLAAPNAVNTTWLNSHSPRYGGVSGDATGQGPFSVWKNAKGEVTGHIEAYITGVKVVSKAAHGLRLLSEPAQIQAAEQFDVCVLNRQKASQSLHHAWQQHACAEMPMPLHRIMAVYGESAEAILQGNYQQTPVISHDDVSHHVTLATPLQQGQFLSWAVRDPNIAQQEFSHTVQELKHALQGLPDFGLLFSCLGRGPYFYDGIDVDLNIITNTFKKMPLLGFYGNGEIASIHGTNQLLPYSAVFSLFSATGEGAT